MDNCRSSIIMSGRCNACDAVLKPAEIRTNPHTEELDDLCFYCCGVVYSVEATEELPNDSDVLDLGEVGG